GLAAFCAAAMWSGLEERERVALAQILGERAALIGVLAVIALVAIGIVIHVVYRRYIVLPGSVAEQARLILSGNPEHRVKPYGPDEMRRLAESINEFAGSAANQEPQLQARIDAATAKLDEERNRLAALMSELALSVLVCNSEGRILLYNSSAKRVLEQREAGSSFVGLGRSIFSVVD